MEYGDFGFDQFGQERRKFAGRRIGPDRRVLAERRDAPRRIHRLVADPERRTGSERRRGSDRRAGERRSIEDRRDSAWRMLEGD